MTDYLELLLDALEDREERETAFRLELERAVPVRREEADRTEGGRDAPSRLPSCSAAAETESESGDGSAEGGWAGEPAAVRAGKKRSGPGDILERMLEDAARSGTDRGKAGADLAETAGTGAGRRWAADGALPALSRGTAAGDGASALERRLSRSAAPAAAVTRIVERSGQAEDAPGTAALDEWDRRLERDARRYDGGMFLY